jgi:hypothetical protein
MHSFDERAKERAPGLSRRQLLGRVGGGLAGATLASLGLDHGRRAEAQGGTISLRDLLRRTSAEGCDPSRGIRVALPNDRPVISIRDVARRYGGKHNHCKPLQLAIQYQPFPDADGKILLNIDGENFTPGGQADIQFRHSAGGFSYSVPFQAQPDGTLHYQTRMDCRWTGNRYTVWAIDKATGRSAEGGAVAYDHCPPSSPPPPQQPPPTPPVIISVTQSGSTFTVKGTGFLPNRRVYIRVTNDAGLISGWEETTSDAARGISHGFNLPCRSGVVLTFTANDGRTVPTSQDITGILWSNSKKVTCA